ncbi:MAG: UDP-N-acetylmuramoyl-tripeptide--D-alanyl-D-alanine ligase [Actinomycetota bacterium]
MRMTASEVAFAAHGTLTGPDVEANGISFDSRSLVRGQAFVAVSAERDGHEFCQDAISRGAAFLLVNHGKRLDGVTCVEVEDTIDALAAIGAYLRQKMSAQLQHRVVGITGSVGKTSTKDLVLAVLSGGFSHAHGPEKSLNNDIGVPITIANAPEGCDALVLEMGMRGFGEIARLCVVGQPMIGVITEVGDAHSSRVGGIDGVVRAKAELVQSLPADGIAIVNADSVNAMRTVIGINARVVTFGSHDGADVVWSIRSVDESGRHLAVFQNGAEEASGLVPLPGSHMVSNAAAAIAVGIHCGMSLQDAVHAMTLAGIASQRMQWVATKAGLRILDDSYNANSLSVEAALHTLTQIEASSRIAVLGQMAEVDDEVNAHLSVAATCRDLGIEILPLETDSYGTAAMSVEEIVKRLSIEGIDTVVLVKGSRVSATERVVHALIA